MKRLFTTLVAVIAIAQFCSGQNIFPTPSGNVGIGTTSPSSALEIQQPILAAQTVQMQQWGWTGTPGTWNLRLDMYHTGSAIDYRFVQRIGYTDNNVLTFSNGNVGIGTTTPNQSLHLFGSAPESLVQASSGNATYALLPASGGSGRLDFLNSSGAVKAIIASTDGTDAIDFYTGALNNRMRIAASGNIGIGTTDPKGYKLAVNGDVIATSMTVKLYANWPDYVFKPNYSLPSLADVKTYIDKNYHLPDMPSEQDVAQNGINLGELVKLQTKKIEELTLYAIDQQQQIELLKQQQEKSKNVQSELSDLKKQLETLTKEENQKLKKEQQLIKQEQDARIAALEKTLAKLTAGK